MVIWIFFAILIVLFLLFYIQTKEPSGTAIVSLVKDPHAFDTWVKYHKENMGIDKFYIYLDDDSETLISDPSLHVQKNWKDRLGYQFDSKIDEPANVRVKQQLIVTDGLKKAQEDGIKYIVHIDSDELLYGPGTVTETFSKYDTDAFHMKNSEMAPDRKDYKNCFMEGTLFHGDPSKFIAYGNGKAGGVAGKSNPNGPHNFTGQKGTTYIPEDELKVLHYPSCNIEETIKRAKNYGNFKDDSAGWSEHHKETRDELMNCDSDCKEKAEKQFEKRMAGSDAYQIDIKFPGAYS